MILQVISLKVSEILLEINYITNVYLFIVEQLATTSQVSLTNQEPEEPQTGKKL